jgi:hypothetical protein
MNRLVICILSVLVAGTAWGQDRVTKPAILRKQLADVSRPATNLPRYVSRLSEAEASHLEACYAQSHKKFWPSNFRVDMAGRWYPAIKVIQILDNDQAIVDMGGTPVIFGSPDIYRVNEMSEFSEKRLLKVVGQMKIKPSDDVGDWFSLRLSKERGIETVVESEGAGSGTRKGETSRTFKGTGTTKTDAQGQARRSATTKASASKDKSGADVAKKDEEISGSRKDQVTRDVDRKSTGTVDHSYEGTSKSKSKVRITHAAIKNYLPVTVFIVTPETAGEVQARGKAKPKPESGVSSEQAAASKLRLAQDLIAEGKTSLARTRLEQLIEKYPDTKAAKKAKDALEGLGK